MPDASKSRRDNRHGDVRHVRRVRRVRRSPSIVCRNGGCWVGALPRVTPYESLLELRDPAEVLDGALPAPIDFRSHGEFVRETLDDESHASIEYRRSLSPQGSLSETVAAGYRSGPGGELARRAVSIRRPPEEIYATWRDPAELPRVTRHLQLVEVIDERRAQMPEGRQQASGLQPHSMTFT